jgi:hypothetical protein
LAVLASTLPFSVSTIWRSEALPATATMIVRAHQPIEI